MATNLLKFSLKTNIVKSIFLEVISRVARFYYVFGRPQPWPTITATDTNNQTYVVSSEDDPPAPSDSYPYELETRKNMTYAKLIDSNDVAIVISRVNWSIGYVYDMYDDYSSDNISYNGATSLDQAKFYVLTTEFNVYKCLYNNNDSSSIHMPTGTSAEPIELSDGYIWQFMYTIPLSLRNKFLTKTHMPVTTALTNQFYSRGAIRTVSIANKGKGYIANTWSVKNIIVKTAGVGFADSILSNVAVTGNAGQFSCSSTTLAVGQEVTISGTMSGTPITGYTDSTTYKIGSTNGSTTFTLTTSAGAAITTSSGVSVSSLQFYVPRIVITFPAPTSGTRATAKVYTASGAVTQVIVTNTGAGYTSQPIPTITYTTGNSGSGFDYIINYDNITNSTAYTQLKVSGDGYNEENPYSLKTVTVTSRGTFSSKPAGDLFTWPSPDLPYGKFPSVTTAFRTKTTVAIAGVKIAGTAGTGQFSCTATTLAVGQEVVVSGTNTGTGSITGYTTPTTYKISVTNGTTTFTLTNTDGSAIATSTVNDGTLTGLSFDRITQYEVDTITVTDSGYGYSFPLVFGTTLGSAGTNVIAGALMDNGAGASSGFSCDLNVSTQKNEAEIIPLLTGAGEIGAYVITKPGIGYTYAQVEVIGRKRIEGNINLPYTDLVGSPSTDPGYVSGFTKASILLGFGVGDLDTKQSNVELLANDGAIYVIKVENGGNGYDANTVVTINGNGTGCTAIPVIANGKITSIRVTNPGSGYTVASVSISGGGGVNAVLRPIISPPGGHGKDAVSELYASTIMFVSKIAKEINKGVDVTNDYRQITILKDPKKFGEDSSYRNAVGSPCAVFTCDVNTTNTTTYSQLSLDDTLNYSVAGSIKQFTLVEKSQVNDKYYLLVMLNDNYLPSTGDSIYKVSGNNTYSISISSISNPDFNKYSGELVYIDNRSKFTSSAEQTLVASTLISF